MEEVVAAARRIERILGEQPDSRMEQIILSMQDQIRMLTKDLKKALEQMASQAMAATPTAAIAAPPAATVAAAQPPPIALPPAMANAHPPPTAPLPPLATAQRPPYPPGRQPVVSRLRGRRPLLSVSTPTARQKASTLLPMQRGGPFCLSLPHPLLAASLIVATSPRNHPEARFLSFPRQKAARAPPRGI